MNLYYIIIIQVLTLNLNIACKTEKKDNSSSYTILKRHILPPELRESSGVLYYKGLVLTFNDSGGKPIIYGYNLKSDSIEQRITLNHVINQDWEDIAQDDLYIYIGDFGNNAGSRDSLIIYKIPKSSIPKTGDIEIAPEAIVFTYPNYKSESISVPWSAFDCEAMICHTDSINIFTKDWTNGTCTIYSLPKKTGKYVAHKLTTFDSKGLITGADISDNALVLIGYRNFMPFIWVFPQQKSFASLKWNMGKRTELSTLESYQTEGICIVDNNNIIISSEETRSPAQMIEMSFDLRK
jgi:hypothetical protein